MNVRNIGMHNFLQTVQYVLSYLCACVTIGVTTLCKYFSILDCKQKVINIYMHRNREILNQETILKTSYGLLKLCAKCQGYKGALFTYGS